MKKSQGVLDSPKNEKILKIAFYASLAILVLLEFVVDKHAYFPFEEIPGFYIVYGFLSCVVIVAVSKGLGKLWLQRGEDYYDE